MEQKGKRTFRIKPEEIGTAVFNLHEYGINTQTREIFLHSHYWGETVTEEEVGVDFRMATTFVKNLRMLDQLGQEGILVHQQSIGGDWNHGIAIYDAIISCNCPVTILAYAHARSMSSVTLQAADLRILTPNCDVVIHYGWIYFEDRVTPVLAQAEWEKKVCAVMLNIYASRCERGKYFKDRKLTGKDAIAFIDKKIKGTDWIMTPGEAVFYGFADGVLGQRKYETIEKLRRK